MTFPSLISQPLIGAVCWLLFACGAGRPEAAHDLFFNLADHTDAAEVDSADVNGAAFVTPFVRLGGDFGADGRAHGLEVFEHLAQFQVVDAPDDGLGHIDGE